MVALLLLLLLWNDMIAHVSIPDWSIEVNHLLSKAQLPPVMNDLIRMLLDLSGASSSQLRALAAECLGEIGALDPSRLSIANSEQLSTREHDPLELCAMLIREHLVKGLRASYQTKMQDK